MVMVTWTNGHTFQNPAIPPSIKMVHARLARANHEVRNASSDPESEGKPASDPVQLEGSANFLSQHIFCRALSKMLRLVSLQAFSLEVEHTEVGHTGVKPCA